MQGWRGKEKGGHDRGNFRERGREDRYKSFNGFERAVSRAASASFALPLRAACELSKNKINYGTGEEGGVFLCGARRSSAREGRRAAGRGGGRVIIGRNLPTKSNSPPPPRGQPRYFGLPLAHLRITSATFLPFFLFFFSPLILSRNKRGPQRFHRSRGLSNRPSRREFFFSKKEYLIFFHLLFLFIGLFFLSFRIEDNRNIQQAYNLSINHFQ